MPVVPIAGSPLLGRRVELRAARDGLDGERLVTVVGPGGCGKTRLVVEVAGAEPDVLGFVELAGLAAAPSTGPAEVAAAVTAACGFVDDPGRRAAEVLRHGWADADGLLVLDNCEHVRLAASVLVAELLRWCPALRVLATSRASLGIADELVVPLGGLDVDGAGAELFLQRARRAQPRLVTGPGVETLAREISRLADGLPLVIELAAAHARALPITSIRDAMDDRVGFLVARPGQGPGRHGSLRASLDWSTQLIGEVARRTLAALAVLNGRFPVEVALAVSGADYETVELLVDHSLVQFDPADGRYLILDTVRDYARSALGEPGLVRDARDRLMGWAVGFAGEVRAGLERADPRALERAQVCAAAVSTALSAAVESGRLLESASEVVTDLAFAWSLRGRCAEGLAWADGVSARFEPVPVSLRWARAYLAVYSGDIDNGMQQAMSTAAAARGAGDDRTRARALTLAGLVTQVTDADAAEPMVAEAASIAAETGDDWCHVEALQILAYCRLWRTDLAGALASVDAAVPALWRLGHPQLAAWDAALRSDVAHLQGRLADARDHGRRGLDLAVGVGEPTSAAAALRSLLQALLAAGRTGAAARVLEAHRAFFAAHPGFATVEALAVAEAMVATGDAETARAAVAATSQIPVLLEEAQLLLAVALSSEDPGRAAEAAQQALSSAQAQRHTAHECRAALLRAAAHRAMAKNAPRGADPVGEAHAALGTAAALGLACIVLDGLDLVAALALDAGWTIVAARLAGAAAHLRSEFGAAPGALTGLLRLPSDPDTTKAVTDGPASTWPPQPRMRPAPVGAAPGHAPGGPASPPPSTRSSPSSRRD